MLEVGLRIISYRFPCGVLVWNFGRLWQISGTSGDQAPVRQLPWKNPVIRIFDLISDFSKGTHPLSRQPWLQYCSRSEKPSYLFCWCFSAMKPVTTYYYVCMLWVYFLKTVELMHDFIFLPVYLICYVAFLDNSSFFTKIWITLNFKQPVVCHELLQIGWNAFGLNSLFTMCFL